MSFNRRQFLALMSTALGAALILPLRAVAATWNKAAFDAIKLQDASNGLQIAGELLRSDIEIIAPDRAENSAIVQLEVWSKISHTESIGLFVEKNPTALIGNFSFLNGALPKIVTRIKMAETSNINIVVKAGERYFTASKNVVVLENGCG